MGIKSSKSSLTKDQIETIINGSDTPKKAIERLNAQYPKLKALWEKVWILYNRYALRYPGLRSLKGGVGYSSSAAVELGLSGGVTWWQKVLAVVVGIVIATWGDGAVAEGATGVQPVLGSDAWYQNMVDADFKADKAADEAAQEVMEEANAKTTEEANAKTTEEANAKTTVAMVMKKNLQNAMELSFKQLWPIPRFYDSANRNDTKLFHKKNVEEANKAMIQFINTNTPSNIRKLFLMTVLGDTLKTNIDFLDKYSTGDVDEQIVKKEMATLSAGTGAKNSEIDGAIKALIHQLRTKPNDWNGSKNLKPDDKIEMFLDAIALLAENTLALDASSGNLTEQNVVTALQLWLSTKAGELLENLEIDGKNGEKVAEILRTDPVTKKSRELLLRFLERINPDSEFKAISQVFVQISIGRMDLLTTIMLQARQFRKRFNDGRQDILNTITKNSNDNKWEQTSAWLAAQYRNMLVETALLMGLTVATTAAIFTTIIAGAASYVLYKVTLGRYLIRNADEQQAVIDSGLVPNPRKSFYTKMRGNKQFWAQKLSNGFLRMCKNKGYQWSKTFTILRPTDNDYRNWTLTTRP